MSEPDKLQPDPMLREGRAPRAWIWVVAAFIVVAVGLLLFVTNTNDRPEAQNRAAPSSSPPLTTGSSTQPADAGGRSTADAPPVGNSTRVPAR